MADFISDLASKCGISPEMAKKGMGAMLAMFKEKLPGNMFSQVESAVPGADSMMADAHAAMQSAGGGILGAVKEMAGKLMGGGSALSTLTTNFTRLGISPEQVQKFVTNAFEFLKSRLPADVMKQITGLIPMGGKTTT
jgi:hypothetical protein